MQSISWLLSPSLMFSKQEKLYAYYLARAAWHGSRIVMRQVSPESPDICDFIIDLYHSCGGGRDAMGTQCRITTEELDAFLEDAATFLRSIFRLVQLCCRTANPVKHGTASSGCCTAYRPSCEQF
ncbi:hypothetical protein BDV25DRAFT_135548 [Aspergillus avenaceus]|uniref:Uncharacterized protein n=1 Tax=Aspergillus avenaceus TaxID=36643 RepID=A0A5N6U8E1_ASPAV|nr:hypothetical protein BDV25DRAFT_135548 [Aspergillus avenaceus]